MESLSNVLMSSPKLSIIAGSVHSGKTRLLNGVIMDLSKKTQQPMQVHSLNLQEKSIDSVESLKSVIDHVDSLEQWLTIANTDDGMDHTPSTQYPILVIDQANKLKKLLRHKDGKEALKRLFQWFIRNTKEVHKSHVVLISSENFFDQWVEQFVGPINYSVYVVGHLDREEAEIYWTENILKKREDRLVYINPLPEFDKVFEVCGGSMYLMDKFFDQYCQEPTDGLIYKDPTNFHAVIQEKRRILTALYAPDEVNSLEEVEQPKWTGQELIELMEDFTATSTGVLDYNDVCFKFGHGVINSMIKHNIVHLRPTSRLAYDVPNHVNPIITAGSPAAFVAMKKVLEEC